MFERNVIVPCGVIMTFFDRQCIWHESSTKLLFGHVATVEIADLQSNCFVHTIAILDSFTILPLGQNKNQNLTSLYTPMENKISNLTSLYMPMGV